MKLMKGGNRQHRAKHYANQGADSMAMTTGKPGAHGMLGGAAGFVRATQYVKGYT